MDHRHCGTIVLMALAAFGQPGSARAQVVAASGTAVTTTTVATTKIDADAMDALNRMGGYLRTLDAFQVKAEITDELVLDDGEKIQIGSVADLVAETPDHLRLEVTSDKQHRLFFYDGKTFTLFAPRPAFYATITAPPTIIALADTLDEKYDIALPFVDLFRWGTASSGIKDITGATDIGPSVIDGVTCEQYAFRQNGLDWQVWIQNGDFPLPRKIVLTTLTDDARPQYTAVYTWNLAPSTDSTTFEFTAPKDAQKITITDAATARRLLTPTATGSVK